MVTSDKGRRGGTGTRCYKATSSAHFVGMVACLGVRGQKMLPLHFGCAVKSASRVDGCPAIQVARFYPSAKGLEGVGNFLFLWLKRLVWGNWNLFCRQVSVSKKLSSEEICQPSDGISGRDQKEMARLEYQVAPRSGNLPGMWKIKVQA